LRAELIPPGLDPDPLVTVERLVQASRQPEPRRTRRWGPRA
jgi:hypothetical protein